MLVYQRVRYIGIIEHVKPKMEIRLFFEWVFLKHKGQWKHGIGLIDTDAIQELLQNGA